MDNDKFWLPQPKRWDFQAIAILVPVIASAIGLFLMSVEALVFAQFNSLPQNFRLWTSIISAFFMAFGGEIGTVSNSIFIFSRWIKRNTKFYSEWDKVTIFDWTGLIVSWLSTALAMFIASSTRPGTIASWQQIFAEWLILPLMLVAVSDVYLGVSELGVLIGQFDMRMIYWIGRKKEWDDENTRNKLLERSLGVTFNTTQPTQKPVYCWCGKQLKSPRAYSSHLRFHINEAKQFDNAQAALDHLHNSYQFDSADFEFPTLATVASWMVDKN